MNGEDEDNYDEVKSHRNFFKQWENQDYDDEFYDRSKTNKFNKKKSTTKITKDDIKEGDTYESVKGRLNVKMKERDALMQKLIEINHESKQKKNDEDYDELDAFMEQNDKQIKKDEKEFVTNRLNDVNKEIDRCNGLLAILMPSSFSTAKKAEPVKAAQPAPVIQQPIVAKKKAESKQPEGSLSSVFHKLSAMAKAKEKELKKNQEESMEAEQNVQSYQTPRFYQSESGTEPAAHEENTGKLFNSLNHTYANIDFKTLGADGGEADQNQEEEGPKTFFSEIIKNIKPVTEDDEFDASKYSNFMKEYTDYHASKSYNQNEGNKRQKTSEESEATVIRFGQGLGHQK